MRINDLGNDPQLLEAFDLLVRELAADPNKKTFDARRSAAWVVLRDAIYRAESHLQREDRYVVKHERVSGGMIGE